MRAGQDEEGAEAEAEFTHPMTLDILKVFDQRIRANPGGLLIYEHEVSKFVDALRGMARDYTGTMNLETDIRSGFFRYRGLPVRVDGE